MRDWLGNLCMQLSVWLYVRARLLRWPPGSVIHGDGWEATIKGFDYVADAYVTTNHMTLSPYNPLLEGTANAQLQEGSPDERRH